MGFFKLTAAKASGLGQRHVPTLGVRREACNKLLNLRVQSKPLLSPKSRPKRERYPSSTAPGSVVQGSEVASRAGKATEELDR